MKYFASEKTGSVLNLIFEDTSSRNSFSVAAARELRSVLSGAGKSFEALVLSARGRVFCSGGNLSDYASMSTAAEGKKVNDEIRSVLSELATLPVPTVCAVSGDCFGGGVELVSCFDQVVAAPHVIFALWQRKISLTYGWGGGSRLERRFGSSQLRALSLSARSIGAREAQMLGLVNLIVPDSKLQDSAIALARSLTALPKEPVAAFKSFTAENEAEIFDSLWWNETHQSVLKPRRK